MKKFLLLFAVLMMAVCVLASCVSAPTATTSQTTTETTYYTVTFEGAEGVESQSVAYLDVVTKPADPEKPGFAFDGWYLDGELYDFENIVTSNVTLTAQWTALEYTVTFDGISQTLGWGELATAPDIDLEANKILLGWFTERNGQGTAFDATAPVYANATYYSYVVDGVTVTFADDDGSILKADSFVVGQLATAPAAPDKAAQNKEFIGWFDGAGNEFNPATAYSASVTFTAKYDQYYIVKFVVAGEVKSEARLLAGAPVVAPEADAVLNGAEFVGWYDAFGVQYAEGAVATADAVYTARYNVKYTVTFVDEDGNQIGEVQEVFDGGNAVMPASDACYYVCDFNKLYGISENTTITLVSIPKTDYKGKEYTTFTNVNDDDRMVTNGYVVSYGTFLWNVGQTFSFTEDMAGLVRMKFFAPTNNDGSAKFEEGQSITFTVSIDGYVVKTFSMTAGFVRGYYDCYVNVPAGTHTVTVTVTELIGGIQPDQRGASVGIANIYVQEAVKKYTVSFEGEGIDIPAQSVVEGSKAQKPADPTRDGYTFIGWLLNGEAYDFTATVKGDITLTAAWAEGTKYTVSFEGEGVAIDSQIVTENSAATKPADPERAGYTFAGWLLDGEAYDFTAPVTGNITLVAAWEAIEYTVTFVDSEGNTIETQTVVYGTNAKLPTSAEYFYTFSSVDALYNITENKTITLGTLPKANYVQTSQDMRKSSAGYSDYFTVTGKGALSYGTTLYKDGTAVAMKGTFVGPLEFYIGGEKLNQNDATGQTFTMEVLVDDVVVDVITYDTNKKEWTVICNVPTYGEHTVTLRIASSTNIPTSNGEYGASVMMTSVRFYVQKVQHTVTFAGEGVDIPAQTVLSGAKATKPADPTLDGYIFAGWLLDGEAYDFTAPVTGDITLTASFTEETVEPEPEEPTEFTVTFVDGEGNTIATETVQAGANATLPTGNTYYACDFASLQNITEDTTIVLTAVSKSDYAKKDYYLPNYIGSDDRMTFDGYKASYGTFLWNLGQSFSFTGNFAGQLRLKPFATTKKVDNVTVSQFAEGQSMTITVAIDGIAVKSFTVDASFARNYYVCCDNIPAGEHTVTITVTEIVGIDNPSKTAQAIGLANLEVYEAIVKHTVTFAGEGVDIPAQTVVSGAVATKPEDPTLDGYIFAGWLLDGEAYDFATPVTGDITLTASFTEETVEPEPEPEPEEPTEFTVTFVDGEGNTIGTQTVISGENATLPTSDTYYYVCEMAELANITAEKTITLAAVEKSAYETKDYLTMSGNEAFPPEGMLATTGTIKNYATLLWKPGQVMTFTGNFAGALQIKFFVDKFAAGVDSAVFTVAVDGVIVQTFTADSTFVRAYYTCCVNMPAGEHVITVTLTEMVSSKDYANWNNVVAIANVMLPVKKAVATDPVVTFVDGEGNVIATQTVAPGANATLPEASEGVYVYSPVDALNNITEDKTVVLSILDETLYTKGSFTTNKSQVTLGGGAQASSSAGTYLSKVGMSMTYTATMVGTVDMWCTATNGEGLQEGDYIDLEIKVDGVVVGVFRLTAGVTELVNLCTLADYAEHTITITSIETNIPDDRCDRYKSCARIYSLEYFVLQ